MTSLDWLAIVLVILFFAILFVVLVCCKTLEPYGDIDQAIEMTSNVQAESSTTIPSFSTFSESSSDFGTFKSSTTRSEGEKSKSQLADLVR